MAADVSRSEIEADKLGRRNEELANTNPNLGVIDGQETPLPTRRQAELERRLGTDASRPSSRGTRPPIRGERVATSGGTVIRRPGKDKKRPAPPAPLMK